jgi:hypothetical protein
VSRLFIGLRVDDTREIEGGGIKTDVELKGACGNNWIVRQRGSLHVSSRVCKREIKPGHVPKERRHM